MLSLEVTRNAVTIAYAYDLVLVLEVDNDEALTENTNIGLAQMRMG